MKRTLLILCVGMFAGLVAHELWFINRRPRSPDSLETQLAWMRAALSLNAEQYQRIKTLHQELEPHLQVLASDIERMQQRSAEFEEQRRTVGEVDFVEYAQLVQQQRATDREYNESTQRLVSAALSIMTPDQRDRYLELIAPALRPAHGSAFH